MKAEIKSVSTAGAVRKVVVEAEDGTTHYGTVDNAPENKVGASVQVTDNGTVLGKMCS